MADSSDSTWTNAMRDRDVLAGGSKCLGILDLMDIWINGHKDSAHTNFKDESSLRIISDYFYFRERERERRENDMCDMNGLWLYLIVQRNHDYLV